MSFLFQQGSYEDAPGTSGPHVNQHPITNSSRKTVDQTEFCADLLYRHTRLKKCDRRLVKNDGSFPPPDLDPSTLYLTASTRNYHMKVTGQYRVFVLRAGSLNDPIRGILLVQDFQRNPLRYEALSYMWGDPGVTRRINLDGNENFPVTINLEKALRHVRLDYTSRVLWVDAICINQEDPDEQSDQVNMMKEIYSRAWNVLVWLDVDLDPDTPCVKRLLRDKFKDDELADDLGDDPEFWNPIIPVLSNEYWDRLWVQQELLFAKRLQFVCRTIPSTFPGTTCFRSRPKSSAA